MDITASTLLLKVDTGDYPLYLQQVRMANPTVSFPENPSEDVIADVGYAVVTPVARPVADVVTEGTPELVDGVYYQTWDVRNFNDTEKATRLAARKNAVSTELLELRDRDLAGGFSFTTSDSRTFGVQLRPEDRVNLLGLRLEAEYLLNNAPEVETVFRSTENVNYSLLPQELLNMCNAALTTLKQVYGASWVLRDQIVNALAIEDIPTLPESLMP